jgi:hypothetical protein
MVRSASWVQLRSYFEEKVAAPGQKAEITAVWIRCGDHATRSAQKLALTSQTCGGRSVGIGTAYNKPKDLEIARCHRVYRAGNLTWPVWQMVQVQNHLHEHFLY